MERASRTVVEERMEHFEDLQYYVLQDHPDGKADNHEAVLSLQTIFVDANEFDEFGAARVLGRVSKWILCFLFCVLRCDLFPFVDDMRNQHDNVVDKEGMVYYRQQLGRVG